MSDAIDTKLRAAKRLVAAVQELSLAHDLDTIMRVVRTVARELSGADGATFVLRDNDQCYYADEDAIAPLWKGRRFPIDECVSGWAMRHGSPVTIDDIEEDSRVPTEVYRQTFVKSLAMVPIRAASPIGAIGIYWATLHHTTPDELELLQALADSTSTAIENVELIRDLEARVQLRTAQLEATNRELEAFSYSISHDLRAPLRSIDGFSAALAEDYADQLDPRAVAYLARIRAASTRMNTLIDQVLQLAQFGKAALRYERVDVSETARAITADLSQSAPSRGVLFAIEPSLTAYADGALVRAVLENLLGNAFKFTAHARGARIDVGSRDLGGEHAFFVRDNGAGFDMAHAGKLFGVFQRLHSREEFQGSGVGLATVQRIVHRHGGRIWAEGVRGEGACFYFTLPASA